MRFLVSLLLMTQFCFAGAPASLRALLDDYSYALTVQWDQQDQVFLQELQGQLEKDLVILLEQGLTDEEISQVTGVNLEKLRTEIQTIERQDPDALRELMLKHLQYQKGASWSGEVFLSVGVTLLFFSPIILRIIEANRNFDRCVDANGGNENPCIARY